MWFDCVFIRMFKPKTNPISFGLIWFNTEPKQMPFGKWMVRPKQMRPNGIISFGTKPKQITFGN